MTPMLVILLATAAVGAAGALLAWRERPEPGSMPLAALLAAQCWWSVTLFFQIQATGFGMKVLWLNVSWVGVSIVPIAWLFFSLEYTGYIDFISRRSVVLVSLIPAITVVVALTNGYHDFLYVDMGVVEHDSSLRLDLTPGIWFWVSAGYTYLLGLLGIVPLLEFLSSEITTFRGQSQAILVGLFVPWVTNILYLLGVLPTGSIDPTPVAFSISGIAYLGAVTRFNLFGTSPAPIRPARRSIFERMREGVIVLDRDSNVVNMNKQAADAIEEDSQQTLGRPINTALPQLENTYGENTQSGQTVFQPEDSNRAYDVSATQVSDTHGRTIGHIITLHDISDYLRQQQRLEVLNRVFRHNIRTNIQVIVSNAEFLADGENKDLSLKVKRNALEIKEFSEKIRMVLDIFEQGRQQGQPVSLERLLQETIESTRKEYPKVVIYSDVTADSVYVDGLLEIVFTNILENAAEHNDNTDPEVRVEATCTDGHVEVAVSDNGPGINEEELQLLREGTETPLAHGSGIGLAIIVWGAEIIGGKVTFEQNNPTGTTVTVEVPAMPRSDC